jgi:hypothetical protein
MVAETTNVRMGQTVAGAVAVSALLFLIVSMTIVQETFIKLEVSKAIHSK